MNVREDNVLPNPSLFSAQANQGTAVPFLIAGINRNNDGRMVPCPKVNR